MFDFPLGANSGAITPIQSLARLLVKRESKARGPQEDFDCAKPT